MTAKSGTTGASEISATEPESALSPPKLAELLGVTDKTIRDWAMRRGLPHYKTPSGRLEFVPSEVRKYLAANGMRIPKNWT